MMCIFWCRWKLKLCNPRCWFCWQPVIRVNAVKVVNALKHSSTSLCTSSIQSCSDNNVPKKKCHQWSRGLCEEATFLKISPWSSCGLHRTWTVTLSTPECIHTRVAFAGIHTKLLQIPSHLLNASKWRPTMEWVVWLATAPAIELNLVRCEAGKRTENQILLNMSGFCLKRLKSRGPAPLFKTFNINFGDRPQHGSEVKFFKIKLSTAFDVLIAMFRN